MARNKKGQITSTKNNVEVIIQKYLENIANEARIRVKPIIRDELERTLRAEIYASYVPATKKGQETQEYNKTHKHQKVQSYHHTGTLTSSIHGTIDGSIVKAGPMEGITYEDGTPVEDVYNYLKFGTTDTPKKDVFNYGEGKFSQYISQEPHNFEARTREYMNTFLKDLAIDLQQHPERYSEKYRNKRI